MKKITTSFKVFVAALSLMAIKLNAQTYCNSGAIVNADEEIYNVMVNGAQTNPLYSFSNGCNTPAPGAGSQLGLYSNFKTLGALTTLIAGAAHSWSVAENECDGPTYYYNGIGIWIDYNQNGLFTDPGENIYLDNTTLQSPRNLSGSFTVPGAALTGSTVMRVVCAEGYSGNNLTPCLNNYGYGETEDYRIDIAPPVPCSGTPASNSVVGPTAAICPNTSAGLAMATTYTQINMTYTWQSSTFSNIGPWTSITNATNAAYATPNMTANTYYQVIVGCANSGATIAATPLQVTVAPTTTNTAPYYENFEGITGNNKLPNCSWVASNMPGVTQTYVGTLSQNRHANSGSKYAAFYGYYISGSNYFYTNGILLNSGVTYSASLWYTTEYYGYTNFTELAIQLGTSQSSTGLVTIASASPAYSSVYKSLSNTFTVASTGLYYVAIKATSAGNYGAFYLSWDDLRIDIPCSLNATTVSLNATPQTTICVGDNITLTASGADTYSWNTGATGPSITETPIIPTTYMVTGTSALTGCSNSQSQAITVNPVPVAFAYSNKSTICQGQSALLMVSAVGANNTYTWNTGAFTSTLSVTPSATTIYTVAVGNQYNCRTEVTQTIVVKTNPIVSISSDATDPNEICVGDAITLSGSGAGPGGTYQWASSSLFISGTTAYINPTVTTTYTLTGTDVSGCSGIATKVLSVSACLGINQIASTLNGVSVYPNPTSGIITVELKNGLDKTIQVTDITGRVILSSGATADKFNVNMSNLAPGIYYVKIESNKSAGVVKVVKQ
jgi:hypothetical protein